MEPNKFKVGDRVRRTVCNWEGAMIGRAYTISQVHSPVRLSLVEIEGFAFNPKHFEFIPHDTYPCPTGVVPKAMPVGAIGDVNSTAKGSGARFNAGKAHLELIPLGIIAEFFGPAPWPSPTPAVEALRNLGYWQEGGKEVYLQAALSDLGNDIWTECAAVFDYGRKKYAEWNWAKGMPWSIPTGCAARHLMAIINGEENDPESGLSHRGHAACNIVMLLQFMKTYPEGDDRPRYLEPTNDKA